MSSISALWIISIIRITINCNCGIIIVLSFSLLTVLDLNKLNNSAASICTGNDVSLYKLFIRYLKQHDELSMLV